ncbi:uncharacterized protein [Temnothorax nylanderi]|uniref:uncharacterized protein n=1 Tax=Temnothorax nylanderi TaxID=102681 RepID=UPI003A8402E5
MEALIKARGYEKGKITTFKNYINKVIAGSPDATQALEDIKRLELIERLKRIREVLIKYDEIQIKIDEITVDQTETTEYREKFEEEYYNVIAQAEMLLARGSVTQILGAATINAQGTISQPTMPAPDAQEQGNVLNPPNIQRQASQNIIYKTPGIKLPTIELPKFRGDISEWLGFRDTFQSLIHTNETIDPIQKFHYLKAALEGKAAQIIKSLEFSAINYAVAWDTIRSRFDNKRLLTQNHIKALFNINYMKEESSAQIRDIVDTLNKHIRALNALGQSTDHWDALLIYLISSKIDSTTAREWEKQCADYELPTLDDFKDFLNSRANLLETLELNSKGAHKLKGADRSNSKSLLIQKQACAVCKEAHRIPQCPKFLELTPQKRVDCLKNAKLCLNCMKSGHFIKDCKAGSCRKCSAKHNTLIHFDKSSSSQVADTSEENSNTAVLCSHNQTNNGHVILSTALILIKDKQEITGSLPNMRIDKQKLQIPPNIKLADPSFHIPAQIDVLLGADCFWNLLCIGQLKVGKKLLTMQKTKLGWIAAGPLGNPSTDSVRCNLSKCVDIHNQIAKFWELEECSNQKPLSQEERECESLFAQTYRRDENGRFIVNIPLRQDPSVLGASYQRALRQLIKLEAKLSKVPTIKEQYVSFLREYEKLGHMTELKDVQMNEAAYYLPHHCVLRSESLTTKIRVVFNASAPTDNGISLNDIQMVGPTLQNDLLAIIIRFRTHTYVISADIEKMFRQVLVTPEQRFLQRILWRWHPLGPILIYQLNTVIYGGAASIFLVIKCLMELAKRIAEQFPEIARIIRDDFYVDDLLSGADSIKRAKDIVHKISSVLASAGFRLRKWVSNEPTILQDIPVEDQVPNYVNFTDGGLTKTLGLVWEAHNDVLIYSRKEITQKKVTKRSILSEITQIFDPLGLLSPCIIIAKMLLQDLWSHKLKWDESLPHDLHSKWTSFRTQLENLKQIRIPRHVVCKEYKEIQLHGFSDASQKAYSACIYIRSVDAQGNINIHLLCSKTRVAPLKLQTITRLELLAALILARLADKVQRSINISFDDISYWTDSRTVLGWLRMQPNRLQVFVSHRVAEIQNLTDCNKWRHVPTKENPADLLSRGLSLDLLAQSKLWWHGPCFLLKEDREWPVMPILEANTLEVKRTLCTLSSTDSPIFKFTANLNHLIRIMAYCKRFIDNCKRRDKHGSGVLTVAELTETLHILAKLAQAQSFLNEIEMLKMGEPITKGRLASLSPFIDNKGLIRVGGRLKNSEFDTDKKHPIVLSSEYQFTKLLFISEHLRLLHAGPQLLLFSIRERFWPIGGRSLARKTVRSCVKCFRNKPQHIQTPMGELPKFRVTLTAPFHATGVDYAGPFLIKDRKGRGSKTSKAFVCLFICFATKAVHLELVSDLTSEAFIAALRRFSSRRGKPAHIYSDNGTNFVGANRELKSLAQFLTDEAKNIERASGEIGITWHFIPAHSPHFGGLWEAGVKSTKHHLRRIAGNAVLTFEEFYTFLTQIEALLNSRPLIPMSSDPNDLTPITPAHFLIGRTLTSVADPTLMHLPESKLSRWQLVQKLQQHFWQRWNKEYISELQQRTKMTKSAEPIKEGTLVVIKEDNLPPFKWKLGRIISIHPGKDEVARVATVKTATGATKITTAKLCPLPQEECTN